MPWVRVVRSLTCARGFIEGCRVLGPRRQSCTLAAGLAVAPWVDEDRTECCVSQKLKTHVCDFARCRDSENVTSFCGGSRPCGKGKLSHRRSRQGSLRGLRYPRLGGLGDEPPGAPTALALGGSPSHWARGTAPRHCCLPLHPAPPRPLPAWGAFPAAADLAPPASATIRHPSTPTRRLASPACRPLGPVQALPTPWAMLVPTGRQASSAGPRHSGQAAALPFLSLSLLLCAGSIPRVTGRDEDEGTGNREVSGRFLTTSATTIVTLCDRRDAVCSGVKTHGGAQRPVYTVLSGRLPRVVQALTALCGTRASAQGLGIVVSVPHGGMSESATASP